MDCVRFECSGSVIHKHFHRWRDGPIQDCTYMRTVGAGPRRFTRNIEVESLAMLPRTADCAAVGAELTATDRYFSMASDQHLGTGTWTVCVSMGLWAHGVSSASTSTAAKPVGSRHSAPQLILLGTELIQEVVPSSASICAARASVRSASATCRPSISLPSSKVTPFPSSAASCQASQTRRAQAISSSDGL